MCLADRFQLEDCVEEMMVIAICTTIPSNALKRGSPPLYDGDVVHLITSNVAPIQCSAKIRIYSFMSPLSIAYVPIIRTQLSLLVQQDDKMMTASDWVLQLESLWNPESIKTFKTKADPIWSLDRLTNWQH